MYKNNGTKHRWGDLLFPTGKQKNSLVFPKDCHLLFSILIYQTGMIKEWNSSRILQRIPIGKANYFANSNMMVVLWRFWLSISVHHIISCRLNIFIFLFDLHVSRLHNVPNIVTNSIYQSQYDGVNYYDQNPISKFWDVQWQPNYGYNG